MKFIKFINFLILFWALGGSCLSQQSSFDGRAASSFSLDELDSANALIRQAETTSAAKNFSEAAALYAQAAANPAVQYRRNSIFYSAALAYQNDGKSNEALNYLRQAVDAGFRKPELLKSETAFASLHQDSRWKKIVEKARKNLAAFQKSHSDPNKARLITDDISTFISAFDLAAQTTDKGEKIKIFKTEYLERGTLGLLDFYSQRKINGLTPLANVTTAMPHYYSSIRTLPRRIAPMTSGIHRAFTRFKKLYPEAVFPDVYFLIGHVRAGGSVSDRGLLIGTEVFNVSPNTPTDEIKDFRQFYHPLGELLLVVPHELVHIQQKLDGKDTLLDIALIEGGADFIANLIVQDLPTPDYRIWGDAHEKQVWERFQKEMNSKDISKWIGNNDKATPEWAAAQGYYVGYKIAKAYYDRAIDKKAALRDLIRLQDTQLLLKESRYGHVFSQ